MRKEVGCNRESSILRGNVARIDGVLPGASFCMSTLHITLRHLLYSPARTWKQVRGVKSVGDKFPSGFSLGIRTGDARTYKSNDL